MKIASTIPTVRNLLLPLQLKNKSIGFVPTMGDLHEGHISLIRKCRKQHDVVVLSIFVNPTQFGPKEDFLAYPRNENNDILLAEKENVDIIFYPSVEEMYPQGFKTFVIAEGFDNVLCARKRRGHFKGVTTVVAKLLSIINPNEMYLGQKDFQQTIILKRMIADLNYPCKIKVCPTVRENNGLALSSRNKYLTMKDRREASVIYRSLKEAKVLVSKQACRPKRVINFIQTKIESESTGKIEYIECLNADNLEPLRLFEGKVVIAVAVKYGKARLIDNIVFGIT